MALSEVPVTDAELRVLGVLLSWPSPLPPSLDEVAEVLGLRSRATVHGHLHALRRAGLVAWEPRRHRTLRALVAPAAVVQVTSTRSHT